MAGVPAYFFFVFPESNINLGVTNIFHTVPALIFVVIIIIIIIIIIIWMKILSAYPLRLSD